MARASVLLTAGGVLLWMVAAPLPSGAAESAPAAEIYSAPPAAVVREKAINWAAERGLGDAQRLKQIGTLWSFGTGEPAPRDLLDRVIQTFTLADPKTEEFVRQCALATPPLVPPDVQPLLSGQTDEFYRQNLRLFYARYLTQRTMYDEALDLFAEIDPRQVVDPATCLFFKAVCQQQLLLKEEGLKTLNDLLKNTEQVPPSYSTVAQLMQYELQKLEDESLDEIARLMRDVERRLDLGRGGQRVQKREDEVIAKLDKIIEKLEQQQGGGGGGGGQDNGGGNSNQSNSPAGDSRVKGTTAPGEVDEKVYKNSGGWGDLPPKAEAKAKQLIDRDFPPHYRAIIEEWNKRLAKRRATPRAEK